MDAARLRPVGLFDALPDDELARCAAWFREDEFLAGSNVVREGEFAYRFFVVLEGHVDVVHDFHRLEELGPGDFFGEIGVASGGRRAARVQARTRCRLASMMPWDFRTMNGEFPEIAAQIEAAITARSDPSS